MESGQHTGLPATTYQLAEQYQVGQPLALYEMQSEVIRSYQREMRLWFGAAICGLLFPLVPIAIFFFQYLTLLIQHPANLSDQMTDLKFNILLSLPSILCPLLIGVGGMMMRKMIAQDFPTSLLICTEGLLKIRPKRVDVTHWDEIRGTLQGPGLGKRKRYKLYRINRKPLLFDGTFEDGESLVNLVRQQLSKR